MVQGHPLCTLFVQFIIVLTVCLVQSNNLLVIQKKWLIVEKQYAYSIVLGKMFFLALL